MWLGWTAADRQRHSLVLAVASAAAETLTGVRHLAAGTGLESERFVGFAHALSAFVVDPASFPGPWNVTDYCYSPHSIHLNDKHAYLLNWWCLRWLLWLRLTSSYHNRLIMLRSEYTVLLVDILNIGKRNLQIEMHSVWEIRLWSLPKDFVKSVCQESLLGEFVLTCWFCPGDCWSNFCWIVCICCGDTLWKIDMFVMRRIREFYIKMLRLEEVKATAQWFTWGTSEFEGIPGCCGCCCTCCCWVCCCRNHCCCGAPPGPFCIRWFTVWFTIVLPCAVDVCTMYCVCCWN